MWQKITVIVRARLDILWRYKLKV